MICTMTDSRHLSKVHELVKRCGVHGEPADWLVKALHPPSDITGVAIPDQSFRPTVRVDYRPSEIISAPDNWVDPTWDLCLVTLPGDINAAYWCAAPPGYDFSSRSTPPSAWACGAIPLTESDSAGSVNVRTYPTAGGPVTDALMAVFRPKNLAYSFRTVARSITAYQTASSLYNQGTVTAAQLDRNWDASPAYVRCNYPTGPGQGVYHASVPASSVLPLREKDITDMCPGSVVAPARTGVYMPLRLLGPSQVFASRHLAQGRWEYRDGEWPPLADDTIINDKQGEDLVCTTLPTVPIALGPDFGGFPAANDLAVGWIRYLFNQHIVGGGPASVPAPTVAPDTNYDRCSSSVTIFRGLHPGATVTVRCFVSLEYAVSDSSPVRNFVKSPAPVSHRAMDFYYRIISEMGYAYPADYNSLGKLLSHIGDAFKSIWNSDVAKEVRGAAIQAGMEALPGLLASTSRPPRARTVELASAPAQAHLVPRRTAAPARNRRSKAHSKKTATAALRRALSTPNGFKPSR